MRLKLLVCLSLVAIVCAQTAPPSPAPAPAAPSTASPASPPEAPAPEPPKVNADDPVITLKGTCSDSSLQGDACKTVITKAQFEKLTDSLQPGMAPPARRQFATRYSQALVMSIEAEKRGLDKTQHFEDTLRVTRMSVLANELNKSIQADASNVTDQDIQDYYQKNARNFELATLIKIFVPHSKRHETPAATPSKTTKSGSAGTASTTAKTGAASPAKPAVKLSPEEQEKADVAAMTKEAGLLRDRLIKGEDPDKLQKEAFVAAGLPSSPPPTKMEKVRRTSLPGPQQSVMDLNPGEVSEVITDGSGNYVYKLVSKEAMPLDAAKPEIKNQLSSQRYREAMQKFQGGAELNDAYFGPSRGPGMPIPGRGLPGAPPKDNDRD